ncbi:MAG: DUF4870 domain-containing protein [Phycisphaerales bacterium]|nr:MAG: DUF4870 domain-containing protein [Phycisphaerales bacterium]
MAEENETPQAAENAPGGQPEQPAIGKDVTNMAMLCHLLAIFTGFLGPLIIWLIKKDDAPFIDRHGKEALNFQLTVLIAMIVSGLLTFICIGFIMLMVVWVADLILCIIAALKASRGEEYRYPLTIRFLR